MFKKMQLCVQMLLFLLHLFAVFPPFSYFTFSFSKMRKWNLKPKI